jgi:hypothetical protein
MVHAVRWAEASTERISQHMDSRRQEEQPAKATALAPEQLPEFETPWASTAQCTHAQLAKATALAPEQRLEPETASLAVLVV